MSDQNEHCGSPTGASIGRFLASGGAKEPDSLIDAYFTRPVGMDPALRLALLRTQGHGVAQNETCGFPSYASIMRFIASGGVENPDSPMGARSARPVAMDPALRLAMLQTEGRKDARGLDSIEDICAAAERCKGYEEFAELMDYCKARTLASDRMDYDTFALCALGYEGDNEKARQIRTWLERWKGDGERV